MFGKNLNTVVSALRDAAVSRLSQLPSCLLWDFLFVRAVGTNWEHVGVAGLAL